MGRRRRETGVAAPPVLFLKQRCDIDRGVAWQPEAAFISITLNLASKLESHLFLNLSYFQTALWSVLIDSSIQGHIQVSGIGRPLLLWVCMVAYKSQAQIQDHLTCSGLQSFHYRMANTPYSVCQLIGCNSIINADLISLHNQSYLSI